MMYEVKCYECTFTIITDKFELAIQAQNHHRNGCGHSNVSIKKTRRLSRRNVIVISILITVVVGVGGIFVTMMYRDNPALLVYWCETRTDTSLQLFVKNEYFGSATAIYVSMHSSAGINITDSKATTSSDRFFVEKRNVREYFIPFLLKDDSVVFDVEINPSMNDSDCASYVRIAGSSTNSIIWQRDNVPQVIQQRKAILEAIQCIIHPVVGDTPASPPCIMPWA